MFGYIYINIVKPTNEVYVCKKKSDHFIILKEYNKTHKRDNSYNFKPCIFKLRNTVKEFKSVKDLRNFLIKKYGYNPDRRTFNKLMENGKDNIPHIPFYKNNEKLSKLEGMIIHKL